jgi:hypothetical protein
VATSSSLLPNSAFQSKSDMSPPAPAMPATLMLATSENRRSARWPTAKAHCRIVQHAAANAITALVVWMKSGQVNIGP